MKIKLQMKDFRDRGNLITALANQGYKTWVEEENKTVFGSEIFVCFNLKDKSEYSGNKIGS